MDQATFGSIAGQQPGVIAGLLSRSYAALIAGEPDRYGGLAAGFAAYDRECFANPDTVGRCVILTCLAGEPIGMAAWDPRGWPEEAKLGHNCVVPEFQGRGLGRAQLAEVLRRLALGQFATVEVTTGAHPFFAPARAMYLSCGFVEINRTMEGPDPRQEVVYYRKQLPG